MNHVLTSHTMQMIYDPQCIKVLKLKIKEGQRRDLLFKKKHSWIYVLRLGKIIDSLFPTVTFEKVQPWKWCRYVFISWNVFWFMQILVHAKNCLHKVKIYRSLVFLESKHVPCLLTLNLSLKKYFWIVFNKTKRLFILQVYAIVTRHTT